MTEGRVRAIAAQVAAAIVAKIKPSVSEEQIRSDVEAVIRQMQENGELTGSDLTDEQIAAVQENAEAAAESAQTAEAARRAAEAAESGAAQQATDATNAAQTAASKATEATEAKEAAETAQGKAEGARDTAITNAEMASTSATVATREAGNASKSAAAAATDRTAAEEAAARAEAAADRLLGMAVVGEIETVDGQTNIVLTGDLAPGTYTFAYLVRKSDGTTETVTIGTYTVEDESETKTYTITWVVDGKTTTETYKEGETPTFKGSTDKAADDEYTYTFAGWSPEVGAATADVTYTAQYTQTAKPTEPAGPTNFADPTSDDFKVGYRLTNTIDEVKTLSGGVATNYVYVKTGDTIEVTGINFTDTNNRQAFDFGGQNASIMQATSLENSQSIKDVSYNSNSLTCTVELADVTDGRIRFSGLASGEPEDITIHIKRDGAWL